MTGPTSGAGTAFPSGALDFTPVFCEVRVAAEIIVFSVVFCLSFCPFSFDHFIVCLFLIYGFFLPL
jgi:hypothetical protein